MTALLLMVFGNKAQLRLDYIETLGRRLDHPLDHSERRSASSFSMAITDPGNCLIGVKSDGTVSSGAIEGAGR